MSATIEITLSLPGETVQTFLGQVTHANETELPNGDVLRMYGVRFGVADPQAAQALKRYIHQRLKELHAEG